MSAAAPPVLTEYEQVVAAHAAHYVALVEREGPCLNGGGQPDGGNAQLLALRSWGQELDNILEVLDRAAKRGRLEWLLPLGVHLQRYFDMTGGGIAQRKQYALLQAAARRLASPELELQAQLGLGRAEWRLSRFKLAAEAAQAAGVLARQQGNQRAEAVALTYLANVHQYHAEYQPAQELYTQALKLFQALGDQRWEAATIANLAIDLENRGQFQQARELYVRSLNLCQAVGDLQGEANSLMKLGIVHRYEGHYLRARDTATQVLALFRELGDRRGEALALGNLASVHISQGEYPQARELCQQALGLSCELGDRRGEANSILSLANVLLGAGDYEQSREQHRQALAFFRELGDRRGEAAAICNLTSVYYYEGNYRLARELAIQALGLSRELGDRSGMTECCTGVGALLAGLGAWRNAAVVLHGALAAAAALCYRFDTLEQRRISKVMARLDTAVADREITADELSRWRVEGEALRLEELVEFTQSALVKAQ